MGALLFDLKGSMGEEGLVLLLCLGSNVFMFGLICFVQVVHYPLFQYVSASEWMAYHRFHSNRTGLVVGIPMLVQLVSTVLLEPRDGLLYLMTALSLGVTAFVSMPIHNSLARAHSAHLIRRLVVTNWLRVIGWGGASTLLALKAFVR